jgi:phosphocarrier protein HPr
MAEKKIPHSTQHAEGYFIVQNDRGLHTRPSTELVKCAAKYHSLIILKVGNYEVNAKSLLGVLTLAAIKGTKIFVIADGKDAQKAVDALIALAGESFYMEY